MRRLPYEDIKRRRVLETIVYVHNLRTDIVGGNQIKTVFDPEYEQIHALEGYDCIQKYTTDDNDSGHDDDEDDKNGDM